MVSDPEIKQLFDEAATLLAQGDESAALDRYDRILSSDPQNAEALCMRGVAYRMLGNRMLEAAATSYNKAMEADPSYPKPHFQSIRLAQSLDRLEPCIQMYKRRILENRVDPRNYAYLAFALLTAGDLSSALQIAETGLAIGPTDAYVHYTRGEILRGLGKMTDAIAAWQTALEHDEAMVDALYSLAEGYEQVGMTSDAANAWNNLRSVLVQREAPREQLSEIEQRMAQLGA